MKVWETTVLVENKGYQPVPRIMETQAPSYQHAKAYFENFGKIVAQIRLKNG
jgi:hypothetical protein